MSKNEEKKEYEKEDELFAEQLADILLQQVLQVDE